jgi:5,10-methylenetetrahydromethanopterin reductase
LKQNAKVGIGFTGSPYSAIQIADLAKMVEKSGFGSIWIAEDYYLRDSITLLSCAMVATEEINVGSGIINPFTRHPALIAQTAATLNELSRGRFILGLGSGELKLIATMGKHVDHPLRAITESVEIIRSLLKGNRLDFQGSDFKVSQAKLGSNPYISESEGDDFGQRIHETKIYLAAIGPEMLDLSARIGDGVLLTAGVSCETTRRSVSILRKVRAEHSDPFTLAGYVGVCLGEPSIAVKTFVADLANIWPQNFIDAGIETKDIGSLKDAYEKRGLEGAASHVTEEMIRAVIALGTVSEIEERISDYEKAGMENPILIPMGMPAKDLIGKLAS